MKIICIGNEMRKDDAVAIEIAEQLGAVKAYTNPENFIKEGDDVILIDAVDFNAEPGSVKEFSTEEIQEFALSTTHNINIQFLEKFCKKIRIIGVQPKNTSYGRGLSSDLLKQKEDIVSKIKLLINK